MSATMASLPQPLPPPSTQDQQHQKAEATAFLQSLLNKNLRVTTTDGRLFWGEFKCTDYESNLVLQHCYEYRRPTAKKISRAAAAASSLSPSASASASGLDVAGASQPGDAGTPAEAKGGNGEGGLTSAGGGSGGAAAATVGKVTLDMTSRYLGLVVVPGKYIVRVEVEEFLSQMRGRQT